LFTGKKKCRVRGKGKETHFQGKNGRESWSEREAKGLNTCKRRKTTRAEGFEAKGGFLKNGGTKTFSRKITMAVATEFRPFTEQ